MNAKKENELPKLDWRPNYDPRSRAYSFYSAAPTASRQKIAPKFWQHGKILDQGSEGACVGFGWTAELIADPFPFTERLQGETQRFAQVLYQLARKHDLSLGYRWAEGASVIGGARSVRDMGFIEEFRWCFSVEEIRDAIINPNGGPVVIGVPWYSGMYETRPSGLVEVSGRIVGGHCLTITGYHPEMKIRGEEWQDSFEVFQWVNSWGVDYGQNGTGLIRLADLRYLMSQNGEACIPMNRRTIKALQ